MSSEAVEVAAEVIEPSGALQVVHTPAVLSDNLAALEAYIDRRIEPYVGAQIDPDDCEQVKEGRKCMADLNKMKAPIEAERKRVKAEYEAPLKEFEGRVRAITAKIDAARSAIKEQVDEADARFRDGRAALLREEYEGCAGAIADVIPFSAILDERWLNRSTAQAKAFNELYAKAEGALKGFRALQSKELRHKDEVMRHYAETLDPIGALELEDRLNERDRELAEFRAAQEAARLAAPQQAEPEPLPQPEPAPEAAEAQTFVWSLSMRFVGDRGFASQVAAALRGLGLTGATIECVEEVRRG